MRLHQGVCTGLQSSGVLTGAGGSTSKVTESHGCGQEANRSHLSLCTWLPEWHLASPKSVVQEKNQGRSHSLFNIPALKVTSYHSAMLSWSHKTSPDTLWKGLYKSTDIRRWGWLGLLCWVATTCPASTFIKWKIRIIALNTSVFVPWYYSSKFCPSDSPTGMKPQLPKVAKLLDFLCSLLIHHVSWDYLSNSYLLSNPWLRSTN